MSSRATVNLAEKHAYELWRCNAYKRGVTYLRKCLMKYMAYC